MIAETEKFIAQHRLLVPSNRILVAVSGGPDSTALLLVLHQLSALYGWKLRAVHVNYHSRGRDSDNDERFVRRLAQKLRIPLSVKKLAQGFPQDNFEERAREIRYRYFSQQANEFRADKIAIAHTADDQVETIIQNMLRGSGLRGAAGMPRSRGKIVRPFLGIRRRTVLVWLHQRSQSYRQDLSNRDLKYRRNWIRWRLLPYLRRGDKNFETGLLMSARCFDRAAEFLEKQSRGQIQRLKISKGKRQVIYRLKSFLRLPGILQGEIIRELLGRQDITSQHVKEVLSVLSGKESRKRKTFKGREIEKLRDSFIWRKLDKVPSRQ